MERHDCAALYGVVLYECVALSLEMEAEAVIGRWQVVRLRFGAVKVCILKCRWTTHVGRRYNQ